MGHNYTRRLDFLFDLVRLVELEKITSGLYGIDLL